MELDDSLKQIARGTGIALIGIASGLLFNFITRLIIARYGLQTDYGVFSLALAVLSFAAMLASLGLHGGATRYIAYYRGKEDTAKVRATVSASVKLSAIASISLALVIFFTADTVSLKIFHTPELALPLKIFAAGIPFFTLIQVIATLFRGFDRIEPQVVFRYVILNSLFLILLIVAIAIRLPFVTVFYAYLTALVITFAVLTIYAAEKLPQRMGSTNIKDTPPVAKELLIFSAPLMGVIMLRMIITWADTLMLGYFKTPDVVGLYNAAHPMAQFISEPLNALALIYLPIATGLYSRNLMSEMKRNYTVCTKWLMFITLPIFLILFLFPEAVLNLFFGTAYVPAATALRILCLGFIISNLLGPNGIMLLAMGRPRFLMWVTLTTAILNVALNLFLIPPLGMVGAAIASAVTIILANVARTVKVYALCRAQPLSKNLLKPAIICLVLAFLLQAVVQHFLTTTWWLLVILFIVYLGIYGTATLFTKSFDKEDIAMLLEIEKRSGVSAAPIKKILRRFL